ncbi:MAG: PhoH family protein, partial [Betaproteobacteria bacterium]
MPLPPAPSRRAALLAPEAFEVAARPRVATTSANEAVATPQRTATATAPTRAGRKADSVASSLAAPDTAPLVQIETRARTPQPSAAPVARSTGTRKAR